MGASKIIKQFTKFLFPFRYSLKDTALCKLTADNENNGLDHPFVRFHPKSEGLRMGIGEMLCGNSSAKIADCFELPAIKRTLFNLPHRAVDTISFHTRYKGNSFYNVTVENVRLYFFESEVGFVEVEFGYCSDKLEDYVECNYFISEIKSDENIFEYERKLNKEESEKYIFTLKELVCKLLSYVGGVLDIKKDCFPDFNADKCIIYSYLLTDKKPENLDKLLFTLRRNYKGSYKVPCDKDILSDSHIKQQFENSYWTASYNGAVNLSFCTGDKTTDLFFNSNFYSKMKDTYYTLFLHVLHQRFAMMKYIGDMGHLDTLGNDYLVMKRELKAAENYYAKAANLEFRAFFKLPSNVEHVNEYFNLLLKTFKINELKLSFDNDLKTLTDICQTYVSRIKRRDEKIIERRKKKIEIFVSLLGTLLAVVTLLNSYWGLLEKLSGNSIDFWSIQILVFASALLVPLITVAIDIVYSVKDIRKMTLELNDEVKENLVESDQIRILRKKQSRKSK